MTSKVSIINAASLLLGHNEVNSIGNQSPEEVKRMSALYDAYYPFLLSRHFWRFALNQTELSQVADAPEVEGYMYAYQLPQNYLTIYKISPIEKYEIYADKLYSNNSLGIKLYYVGTVEEDRLPQYYVEYLIEKMAEIFAMPLTQKPELVQLWGNSSLKKLNRAIALDVQSQPSLILQSNPIAQSKYIAMV